MDQLTVPTAVQSNTPHALDEVKEPDCNLAIWKRDLVADFEPLLVENPSDVRFQTCLSQLAARLHENMSASGFADVPIRDALIDDVQLLADHYCRVLDIDAIEVRLEVVTTNSCRKWHADYVKARLITTYAGTGTQWLDSRAAARVKTGQDPDEFGQMAVGDVGVFKGKLATEHPAIHRSPPIEGTGECRLLLVLNPADS